VRTFCFSLHIVRIFDFILDDNRFKEILMKITKLSLLTLIITSCYLTPQALAANTTDELEPLCAEAKTSEECTGSCSWDDAAGCIPSETVDVTSNSENDNSGQGGHQEDTQTTHATNHHGTGTGNTDEVTTQEADIHDATLESCLESAPFSSLFSRSFRNSCEQYADCVSQSDGSIVDVSTKVDCANDYLCQREYDNAYDDYTISVAEIQAQKNLEILSMDPDSGMGHAIMSVPSKGLGSNIKAQKKYCSCMENYDLGKLTGDCN